MSETPLTDAIEKLICWCDCSVGRDTDGSVFGYLERYKYRPQNDDAECIGSEDAKAILEHARSLERRLAEVQEKLAKARI